MKEKRLSDSEKSEKEKQNNEQVEISISINTLKDVIKLAKEKIAAYSTK